MVKPVIHLWIVATISGAVVLDGGSLGRAWAGELRHRSGAATVVADGELTLFLAGDAIITQPWSGDTEPSFQALIDTIRAADVALVNLEEVLHDFEGYAQADGGGVHLAARPAMAHELAWAGIDMVSGANNHTFDYGSTGVLDTLDSVAAAGLEIAGSGPDLQAARAPAYLKRPDGTVALVSTASTFVPYGKASHSRPDMHGRPGLNPMTTAKQLEVPSLVAQAIWSACRLAGLHRQRLDDDAFTVLGLRIQGHEGLGLRRGDWIDPRDLEENLASVRAASAAADLVVFSIHAHQQGRWLTGLAHQVIDAGADVFFAHGPHEVMGIEIYHGRPIIYGPGDFVFQIHEMERFPVEVYSQYGVDPDATIEELRPQLAAKGRLFEQRAAWEAFGAVLRFRAGKLDELRLLPLDLGLDRPLPLRGKPHLADAEFGRRLIAKVGELSRPYGTAVRYLEGENVGVVDLGGRQ